MSQPIQILPTEMVERLQRTLDQTSARLAEVSEQNLKLRYENENKLLSLTQIAEMWGFETVALARKKVEAYAKLHKIKKVVLSSDARGDRYRLSDILEMTKKQERNPDFTYKKNKKRHENQEN